MNHSQIKLAALLILSSELFLVCSGMVIKQIGDSLPTIEIVFFRNIFGLLLLTPWLLKQGLTAIKTPCVHLHILRATVGVTAMSCLFYSWSHLPLAQAALLKQTAPFFMPIVALWWLKEKVSKQVLLSILVGFAGVFLILNPSQGVINIAVFIALFGAMLGACAKVVVRRMRGTETPGCIVFYFALFSTTFSAIPAYLNWVSPTLEQLAWLLLMALTSTTAQLLLSRAYGFAPAGQLGPFTYGSVVFATLFGWLFWQEVLTIPAMVGMFIVFIAGILAVRVQVNKVTG